MSSLLANTSTTSTSPSTSTSTISIHQLECIIQKRLNIKWVYAKQLIHDALNNCEINTISTSTNIPIYRQEEIIEEAYEIYTDLSHEEQNQMKINQTISSTENDNNNNENDNNTPTPNNTATNVDTSTSNINKNTTTNATTTSATTNTTSTSNSNTNIEPEWKRKLRIQAERRESEWYVQHINSTKQNEIQELLRQQQIVTENEIPLTIIKSIRTINQNDSTNNGIEQPKNNNHNYDDNEIPIVRIKRTTCYCIIQ